MMCESKARMGGEAAFPGSAMVLPQLLGVPLGNLRACVYTDEEGQWVVFSAVGLLSDVQGQFTN